MYSEIDGTYNCLGDMPLALDEAPEAWADNINGDYLPAVPIGLGEPKPGSGYWSTVVEYGFVKDPRIDHYRIVYAHHTDTLTPTVIQGGKFVALPMTDDDIPREIIAYDATGKVVGHETMVSEVNPFSQMTLHWTGP